MLNQLDLYPKETTTGTQVLFINFGEKETDYCLPRISKLRAKGIRCEMYPDAVKMKKQMTYANAKNVPYVVLAGDNEIAENKVMLKNMEQGTQELVTIEKLLEL